MKSYIFGLGTGRCGTHSLQMLLNSQQDTSITHEMFDSPSLKWSFDEFLYTKNLDLMKNRSNHFIGDVGFYWLPYVEELIGHYGAKFIVLQRDRESTVKSYLKKTKGRNHWQTHNNNEYRKDKWDICYPKFECSSKKEAIGLYWDLYYDTVHSLMTLYPENFKLYSMQDLNNEGAMIEMLEWLGFSHPKYINFREEAND
jgi:hypothetical protein